MAVKSKSDPTFPSFLSKNNGKGAKEMQCGWCGKDVKMSFVKVGHLPNGVVEAVHTECMPEYANHRGLNEQNHSVELVSEEEN